MIIIEKLEYLVVIRNLAGQLLVKVRRKNDFWEAVITLMKFTVCGI